MDAGGNGEKSTTFRWTNVARYAVASVMTVLIATVVVIAIKTIMRPDSLNVEVIGGSIFVDRPPGSPPNHLQLVLKVRLDNPSGRAVMYYYNVTVYLFDKNVSASTPNPVDDSFFALYFGDMAVQQQEALSWSEQLAVDPVGMTSSYFYMLYKNRNARINDVTMRMEGYQVTEPVSGYNTTARWTTYYCGSLVVGWAPATTTGGQNDDEANKNTQGNGFCTVVLRGA